MPAPPSDYEQRRQQKIAHNHALLQQLQLAAHHTALAPSTPASAPAARPHKRRRPADKPATPPASAPRRSSARLQGIVADSDAARQKDELDAVDAATQRDSLRAKRQRVAGDIHLGDAVVNGRAWERAGEWLADVAGGPSRDEEDPARKGELGALRESLAALRLWDGAPPNAIRITPERVYSAAFHPTPEKPLVFAGDKLGNLGLFDASQEMSTLGDDDDDGDEAEPAITSFKLHSRPISAINFSPHDANALYTASYDSSIRRLDLQRGTAVEVWVPPADDDDEPVSGVEISPTDPHVLHFSTLNGTFGRADLRAPARQAVMLAPLSDKKIGGFSLHPRHPHLMASAGLDRKLQLWDLRGAGSGTRSGARFSARAPALLAQHTSRLSVSHAAFNAAGQIATASYDDTIKIHQCDPTAAASADPADAPDLPPRLIIPHNCQTGRWVTILRPQWQARPADGVAKLCIANMARAVDVFDGATGQRVARLADDAVTAVPAVAQFHPSRNWVAGGTASGKCCLWL